MILVISVSVFLSVLLLAIAIGYQVVLRKSVLLERLDSLLPQRQEKLGKAVGEPGVLAARISRLGEQIKLPQKEHNKYTQMVVAAGMRREMVYALFGAKILLAALLPLLYIFGYAVPRNALVTNEGILCSVTAGIFGYLGPSYWLYAKKKSRQLKIFHTLPDILDLLTVCVEAGLSMDAALIRTTETPQFADDPLANEIKIATMETRAGKPRIESLKDMAERTMVDDVRSFTTMLSQTEKFGTSLSQALRTYADSLRTKRRQMAEEAAAKTTIKMIFPLILFIFPALLVVILGPAVIQIQKIFK
jgi:tight adherence protein C